MRYLAAFRQVAVTAAQDIFEITAPAVGSVKIWGVSFIQATDVKDAEEEILRFSVVRGFGSITPGSGGSTVTPRPLNRSSAAFPGTVKINNTTRMAAGTGTLEDMEPIGWNVRIPVPFWYPPELCPIISAGDRLAIALVGAASSAPADSITMDGCIWFELQG